MTLLFASMRPAFIKIKRTIVGLILFCVVSLSIAATSDTTSVSAQSSSPAYAGSKVLLTPHLLEYAYNPNLTLNYKLGEFRLTEVTPKQISTQTESSQLNDSMIGLGLMFLALFTGVAILLRLRRKR